MTTTVGRICTCVFRSKQGGHGGMRRRSVAANGVDKLRIEMRVEGQLVKHHVLRNSSGNTVLTLS